MLHLVHRSKGRCSCRKSLLKLMRRIQQTTLKNIRKPIRLGLTVAAFTQLHVWNRYKLSVDAHGPNTFGAFAVRARARCTGYVPCACAHGVYLLVDHCFPCACTASKDRFSLYTVQTCTVYRTMLFYFPCACAWFITLIRG